jgi:hypothetical protein
MQVSATDQLPRRSWRIVLLILVLLPFLPELIIAATAALAAAAGCHVEDKAACLIGPLSPSGMIAVALSAGTLVGLGFGFGVAILWLVLCFIAASVGWTRLWMRLLLGAVITVIFALLPYIAPALAIAGFVNASCQPNEGGVGPCVIYGVDIDGAAHEAVTAIWLAFLGVPIALGMFVIYAVVIVIVRALASRRRAQPGP